MENKDKKTNESLPENTKEDTVTPDEVINIAYPHYPASDDIYSKEKEVDLDPEDTSKKKSKTAKPGDKNEKDFKEDVTGEDLDVPGSKADKAVNNAGSEDEENNYYSLGGDNHNDLEEDNG